MEDKSVAFLLLFSVYILIGCLLWCGIYLYALLIWHRLPRFDRAGVAPLARLPRLSVIVAARDEAGNIAEAVSKLCRQSYPDLEIIVVDDRSTDGTGEIIDRLALQDPRLQVVHITTLPEDWVGKVHALHVASQQASGEWLLFSDADIHYETDLLPAVVSHAVQNHLDHFSLIPQANSDNWLLRTITRTFGLLFMIAARADAVADPKNRAAIGIGAFNLVRRDAFEQTEGFGWLRMETVDDVGLAFMMKAHGFRSGFATAYQDLSVTWYPSVCAMAHGFEKNAVGPLSHYRYGRLFLVCLFTTLIVLAPYLSLLQWHSPLLWGGISWLALNGVLAVRAGIALRESPLPWFLMPIGILVFHAFFLRAAYLLVRRKGIIWRGTFYPIALLRKYQRLKL